MYGINCKISYAEVAWPGLLETFLPECSIKYQNESHLCDASFKNKRHKERMNLGEKFEKFSYPLSRKTKYINFHLPPNHFPTVPKIYLFLQNPDLNPLVVELVALLPHSLQQLCDALLLAVDHPLIREESHGKT